MEKINVSFLASKEELLRLMRACLKDDGLKEVGDILFDQYLVSQHKEVVEEEKVEEENVSGEVEEPTLRKPSTDQGGVSVSKLPPSS